MIKKNVKIFLEYLFVVIFIVLINSCYWHEIYKAGNLVDLDYPITTKLPTKIVRQFTDTLIQKRGYAVPAKWKYLKKLVDIDSTDNVRIYFKDQPEEMYLISYGGMLTLSDVYNPQIVKDDWVSERDSLPLKEYVRIQKRLNILMQKIDSMSRRDASYKYLFEQDTGKK